MKYEEFKEQYNFGIYPRIANFVEENFSNECLNKLSVNVYSVFVELKDSTGSLLLTFNPVKDTVEIL